MPSTLQSDFALEDAAVAQVAERGHTVVRGLASADEVDRYRSRIEEVARDHNLETRPLDERDTYGKAFRQTANLWRHDDVVAEFVLAPRFARVAAMLLGVERVRLYHDQALLKEAHGGPTPWHQDQFYWPISTDRTITMWMPLVDVPAEVGSMTFAAGTHLAGALSSLPISDESEDEFDRIVREEAIECDTHGACRAGDATFHLGWTLHRAGGNPTETERSVMTIIYVADGARVAEPETPFQEFDRMMWLDGRDPGQLIDSDLNPLLG